MKFKTIRVRRNRPSALALALALMLTILFVYLISRPALSRKEAAGEAAARANGSAEVRMEGLEAAFRCDGRYASAQEARIAAARCAQSGGAGIVIEDGEMCAVVREAVSPGDAAEGDLIRRAGGLTLRLSGPAAEIQAAADALSFLRAQAAETGGLAAALEAGDVDAPSVAALLKIYRTRGARALDGLDAVEDARARRIAASAQSALARLDAAISAPSPAALRHIHAAAANDWIDLLESLAPNAA